MRKISIIVFAIPYCFLTLSLYIQNFELILLSGISSVVVSSSIITIELLRLTESHNIKIQDSKYFFCKDHNVKFEGKIDDAIHYGCCVIQLSKLEEECNNEDRT